jgi:hypothetical protein
VKGQILAGWAQKSPKTLQGTNPTMMCN